MVITREVKEAIENSVNNAVSKTLQNKDFIKTITDNITEAIIKTFENRLTEVEESVASLNTKFEAIKTKNENKIKYLEESIVWEVRKRKAVEERLERFDQINRLTSLRVFNLKEKPKEDTRKEIIELFNSKMAMKLNFEDIEICYRVGNKNAKETRGVYLKLKSLLIKQNIYTKKKMLKGTGIVIKEDLTKAKLELANKAAEKIGVKNVWTENGKVFIYNQGIKQISNMNDLERLEHL